MSNATEALARVQFLIVEFGSQTTALIGRSLRELGFRSIILPPKKAADWLAAHSAALKGIVLSGGDAMISDFEPGELPISLLRTDHLKLAICLGIHWVADALGGRVEPVAGMRGYGPEELTILEYHHPFFWRVARTRSTVWMSHGESVTKLPPRFHRIAETESCPIAAMASDDLRIVGVQFHPEVTQTECGIDLLRGFAELCGAVKDWLPGDRIAMIQESVAAAVRPDEHCLLGFSGGKDSSTVAAILRDVLGDRLHPVVLDHGALRTGEPDEIRVNAAAVGYPDPLIVNCADRFIPAMTMAGIHSEAKRKTFQRLYADELARAAARFGAVWVAQGTLNTDLIEAGLRGGALIKTHHNTGLLIPILPDHPYAARLREASHEHLPQLHPLHELFKYEVEALGRTLRLPDSIVEREPFPGPGLFCRIFGIPVTPELIETIQWADYEVRGIVRSAGMAKLANQLVVGLDCSRTTGVKGDARAYGYAIVYRGLRTADFMTGYGAEYPPEVRRRIKRVVTKHPLIVRAYADETDKPSATTEFE